MIDPETIQTLQAFAYGFAQNLIASVVVEGKKLKDDKKAQEWAALLARHEHSKPLQDRISQKICEASRQLELSKRQGELMLVLASDPLFGAELAQRILADRYSPEEVTKLIIRSSPSAEGLGDEVSRLASILAGAVQSAIAEDPHLWRVKTLQFQAEITARVEEVRDETLKAQALVGQGGQAVVKALTPEIQTIHAALKVLSEKISEPDTAEGVYRDRLEQARHLMETGKPVTARQMLEALRNEIAKMNVPKSLLSAIATNIASCAIQLDDKKSAVDELELAFSLDPESPKAITNLSAAKVLRGEPGEALELAERARKLLPHDSIATANYVQALFGLGREAELGHLVERDDWITKDANCCFVIGALLFERDRFGEAEKFLRLGLAADPAQPRLLVTLAHSILRPIQSALVGQPIFDWKFPPDARQSFDEAEDLLTRAIVAQEGFESCRLAAFARVLRAEVRRLKGAHPDAIADCEVALQQDPSDESALVMKALSHLHSQQLKEAIAAFERIKTNETKKRILYPWATAYNAAGKAIKAVELLKPYWETSSTDPGQIRVADQLLCAYNQLGDYTAAEAIVGKLQSTWPKNCDALAVIGHYRNLQGKVKEAVGLLSEALAYASGPARDIIALELAEIYYARGDFSQAAELYEAAADLSTANEFSQRYVLCVYHSGSHKEALRLAESLRRRGEPIPIISQIEANVLAEIGDLGTAQQLMERLSCAYPKVHQYRIAVAEFAMRRGRHAEARALLEQIPSEEVRANADVLLRAGQLRAVLGMGGVLELAYQARRVGYGSPHVHAVYVSLFVSREQVDEARLAKEAIDVDCGVILQIGGERRAFTILCESDLRPERGEISRERARRMQLLGRRKDEKFASDKDGFGNDIECMVIEVQSKYVRAFQDTLEKFPALFPGDRTLQGVPGPYDKFRDGLLRRLDEQEAVFQRIASFYEARLLTFETFAIGLHCSPLQLWGMLTGGRYCAFANFSGATADARAEAAVASEADSVLIDLTAILAFGELALLERLPARYKLFTTQPVFDSLAEALAQAALSKPGLSLAKVGDQYVRRESTADELGTYKNFLEKLLKFMNEKVTALPVPALLEENELRQELRELLGPISTATLLAARATQLPLHSEDQMLRALGFHEWGIRGISAQSVLNELASKNIITENECVEAMTQLFFMNFRFVLIGADNVMWALRKLDYELTEGMKKMLSTFHGPQCVFDSAIEVLAETTKRIWLEHALYHRRLDLLYAFLDALGTERQTNQVVQHFTRVIKLKLYLVPSASDKIAEHVRLWGERRLGRLGLIVPSRYRSD